MPEPKDQEASERLQKVLARAGVASRRTAEALISAGRVAVNGVTVTTQGTKVDPDTDRITVDGAALVSETGERQTWVLHKPAGMVTTLRDPQGRPTIRTLVADLPVRLYPVGRLDWDAEGLLLMSNDGDLTHRLTHPSYGVLRTYSVVVKGDVSPSTLEKAAAATRARRWPRPRRRGRACRGRRPPHCLAHHRRRGPQPPHQAAVCGRGSLRSSGSCACRMAGCAWKDSCRAPGVASRARSSRSCKKPPRRRPRSPP